MALKYSDSLHVFSFFFSLGYIYSRLQVSISICCICRLVHYFSHSLSWLQFSPFLLFAWSSSAILAATNINLERCGILPLHCIFALIHCRSKNRPAVTSRPCELLVLRKRNGRKGKKNTEDMTSVPSMAVWVKGNHGRTGRLWDAETRGQVPTVWTRSHSIWPERCDYRHRPKHRNI